MVEEELFELEVNKAVHDMAEVVACMFNQNAARLTRMFPFIPGIEEKVVEALGNALAEVDGGN